MVDVETRATIARPIDQVAAYATDPNHAPAWCTNVRRVTWRNPPPLRVGSLIDFEARFLGRIMRTTYEVVEYAPGRRLKMRTSQGPSSMETTYSWHAHPDGTEMHLRNRGQARGFSRWMAPFMATAMRRADQQGLATLKGLLER